MYSQSDALMVQAVWSSSVVVFVYNGYVGLWKRSSHLLSKLRAGVSVVNEIESHRLGCTGYCLYIRIGVFHKIGTLVISSK